MVQGKKNWQALAGRYYKRFQELDKIARGGFVYSFEGTATEDNEAQVRIRFPALRKEVWVPKDEIDVGSEVWEDGDEGVVWIDALWSYRNGLVVLDQKRDRRPRRKGPEESGRAEARRKSPAPRKSNRKEDTWVEIEVEDVDAETEAAILVDLGDEDMWIPKSQISPDSDVQKKGDEGTLLITEWIAKEKGLI